MKKRMLGLLSILVCSLVTTQAQKIMQTHSIGKFITIGEMNGYSYRAYSAGSKNAKGGILLVHDYFGITEATKKSVEKLADLGYDVIAVDLYRGKSAMTNDSAVILMNGKDSSETLRILLEGINYLEKRGKKLAAIGFSAGGIDAVNAALIEPDLFKATIVVYGGNYDKIDKSRIEKLRSPVLAITGSLDSWPLTAALNFLTNEKSKKFELHVFSGVDHGYAQPLFNGGKNFNDEATQNTWHLIIDFLSKNLN
ncbi:MAG TPA: dienelactone hydrolase family protein [Puia sp.]|nr:dienelactone hydrolase family protein [Puia sp.]